MGILETLTFSESSKRTAYSDPMTNLRRRMAAALDHQISGAICEQKGETYFVEVVTAQVPPVEQEA